MYSFHLSRNALPNLFNKMLIWFLLNLPKTYCTFNYPVYIESYEVTVHILLTKKKSLGFIQLSSPLEARAFNELGIFWLITIYFSVAFFNACHSHDCVKIWNSLFDLLFEPVFRFFLGEIDQFENLIKFWYFCSICFSANLWLMNPWLNTQIYVLVQ